MIRSSLNGGVLTSERHGLQNGDYVYVCRNKWHRLWMLLVRPRVYEVTNATTDTFEIIEQRVNWKEWRAEVKAAVKGVIWR